MGGGTEHPEGLGYHTGEESYNPQISLPTDKWTGRWFAEEAAGHVSNPWYFCHFSCQSSLCRSDAEKRGLGSQKAPTFTAE